MKRVSLKVMKRDTMKKSDLRKLRENDLVPGVIYGEGLEDNILISVPLKNITNLIRLESEEDFLVELEIEKSKKKFIAVLQDEQFNPITDEVTHVDFYSVSLEKSITSKVPIHFIGEPIGAKEGGVLFRTLYEVELEAKPLDLPSFIEVNISDLKIGDSIHISDLEISPNVKILHNPDETIVTVSTPTKEEVKVEEVPVEAEEVTQEGAGTQATTQETKEKKEEKK
ncbi:MAG TPA: 50S ribosomal protein L25 [Caldisericia bacterium]|nr:50S ribosomal protein L25 [Caldisericia bacterium]HPP43922.1 50S ribosomal protein L25 [Caldisericia bacterium]HRT37141.1 50S ribosomal protein L25 [Caldisericia bacterium]HRU74258.1 50S ribosomal protein L25 [Caldisericia bacterium]